MVKRITFLIVCVILLTGCESKGNQNTIMDNIMNDEYEDMIGNNMGNIINFGEATVKEIGYIIEKIERRKS